MSGPLANVERRLDWAWKHIEDVQDEVTWLTADGPFYDVDVEPQADGLTYLFRAKQLRTLDASDLSHLVGDAVHDLRASLDNLAWALVSAHRKPRYGMAFPVCKTESKWRNKALPMLEGIPKGAIEIIEREQPYKAGNRKYNWLWLLNQRWNRDKHRSPAIVGMVPSEFSPLGADRPGEIVEYFLYGGEPLEDGMPVGHVTYADREHTYRKPDITFEIGIEEGPDTLASVIPGTLESDHRVIRHYLLEELRRFL